MTFNPFEDSEDAKAERTRLGVPDAPALAPIVGISYDDALQKGLQYMAQAKQAWDKATGVHLRAQDVANDVARATFLQTRALAFYQYAALVKPNS